MGWTAARATLVRRASVRATAEAAGRMPGVRRVKWSQAAAEAQEEYRPIG